MNEAFLIANSGDSDEMPQFLASGPTFFVYIHLTLIPPMYFCHENASFQVRFRLDIIMEVNTMNSNQTVPLRAV